MPSTGIAVYTGPTIGHRGEADGALRVISSNVTLTADFDRAEAAFATDASLDIASGAVLPELAINGTPRLQGNALAGTGTTAGGLTGPVDGRFFGPAAEEVAGAFDLRGAGVERYLGSFGAER